MKASREQLVRNCEPAQGRLPQLEAQARHALVSGREDQARFALQIRQVVVVENDDIEVQIAQMEQEERSLSLVEHRLPSQIEAFFARQDVLAARYTSAEAQVRIRETLGGVSEDLAGLDLALGPQRKLLRIYRPVSPQSTSLSRSASSRCQPCAPTSWFNLNSTQASSTATSKRCLRR